MKIFDWKKMDQLDRLLFLYIPAIAIVVISVVLADSFRQGILLFATLSVAYLSIQFLLQGLLLFLPSYRKKSKEDLKRQQSMDCQDPSFSLCLKYPDREEKISKKINDFLLASGNAKNKTFAMIITAAEGAGLIMPEFDRGVVAKKFNINRTELSRNLNRKWEDDEEKSIELYQKEFLKMKDVFDAAEERKKTK